MASKFMQKAEAPEEAPADFLLPHDRLKELVIGHHFLPNRSAIPSPYSESAF